MVLGSFKLDIATVMAQQGEGGDTVQWWHILLTSDIGNHYGDILGLLVMEAVHRITRPDGDYLVSINSQMKAGGGK